jgi:hypothetical protein
VPVLQAAGSPPAGKVQGEDLMSIFFQWVLLLAGVAVFFGIFG